MKTICKIILIAFICSLYACVSNTLIDKVPSMTPKGYVEFYKDISYGMSPNIYSIVDNKDTLEGSLVGYIKKASLRIAKTPGNYLFSVRLGSNNFNVPVEIKEGMITRVKILFYDVVETKKETIGGANYYSSSRKIWSYKMSVNVEDTLPIVGNK